MAEWADWSQARDWIELQFNTAIANKDNLDLYVADAWTQYYASNDHAAIYEILFGLGQISQALRRVIGYYGSKTPQYALLYCLDYLEENIGGGEAYELTMKKIIDVMWTSNPLETFFYVNYIDGMRASIWNLEIQETRLQDIYRHFSSWE